MAANKKTYRVKTYILHDGQELADGDDVDLTKWSENDMQA